ncbi:MAG: paraquat-inducible protein A [Sulfurimicrobium sp.]|nr:paraquat-inducible protein A [Sulfurimicrobium sp.]MDP1703585.1 paraquat-inducible protein A [Sulfurimicrobium sp.]MDP2197764.1 paraquat-inducible protein A [Sulfurimicrobium sp.]MDP3686313.1 paraquat-inducible protein A [Sulfurimicrobium sp.]MDZ7657060.1 paraquat-inducible protein A [Sulfurimicrobium sp.]
MPSPTFVACLECDLLHRHTPLPHGGEARCTRCGARLYRCAPPDANERALAFALTACVLFVIANVYPIVGLEVQGMHNSATLIGAVESLWDDGARMVAALVFVTTILVPAVELIGLTWVLVALRQGARGRGAVPILHFIESVKPWGMVEVFLLGVLVSLVKLAHIATVEPGVALFSFGALMAFIAAAASAFDPDAAWTQLDATP